MQQTGTYPPPKSINTNSKVNRANAQFRFAEIYVHRHMASCVLSSSKHFQCLKTLAPFGEKNALRSRHFLGNKNQFLTI
jgi:hypothetical protein